MERRTVARMAAFIPGASTTAGEDPDRFSSFEG